MERVDYKIGLTIHQTCTKSVETGCQDNALAQSVTAVLPESWLCKTWHFTGEQIYGFSIFFKLVEMISLFDDVMAEHIRRITSKVVPGYANFGLHTLVHGPSLNFR